MCLSMCLLMCVCLFVYLCLSMCLHWRGFGTNCALTFLCIMHVCLFAGVFYSHKLLVQIRTSVDFERTQGHNIEAANMAGLLVKILKQAIVLTVTCIAIIMVAVALQLLYYSPEPSQYLTAITVAHLLEVCIYNICMTNSYTFTI